MRPTTNRLFDAPPRELFKLTTCGPAPRTFRVFQQPGVSRGIVCDYRTDTIELPATARLPDIIDMLRNLEELAD